MARQVTAGILLDLNDQLSPKIQGAGIAVEDFADKTAGEAGKVDKTFTPKIQGAGASAQGLGEKAKGAAEKVRESFSSKLSGAGIALQGFAGKAVGAAEKVNKAFSGVAGTLGALGISIGAMGLAKASIDYEDAMIRVGTNAGMSAREVNSLRRELLAAASGAKISLQEMESYAAALAENSIGYEVISESAEFTAAAIQGLGISGKEAADLLSVLVNRGADVETFKEKLNNLAEIDDRLQGMGLAEFTRYLPQLMEQSGVSVDNIEDLYMAVLTLNNGAKNTKAIAQYTSAMQDFASPETRDKLRKFFNFDTKQNGELKSFAEIMGFVTAQADKIGDHEALGKVLGLSEATVLAMKQFNNHYQETINKVGELGDTSGAVSDRAARNAQSLKSALTGLRNAIMDQADSVLVKPIETLARLLNEHPDGLEKAITGVGIAVGALAVIKAGSGLVSFVANLKDVFGGGKNPAAALNGAGGGAGIPVHVTNWGGALPGSGGMQPLGGGLLDQYGKPIVSGAGNIIGKQPLKGVSSVSSTLAGIGIIGAAAGLAYTGAQIAHTKLEPVDPAVPGMGNYYNLNWGQRRKAWEKYEREHPDEPSYQQRIVNNNTMKVDDLIVTPQGQFSTHPDDYIFAMKNPAALVNPENLFPSEMRNEVHTVERVPPAIPPVTVNGEIELRSELFIDDRGYRLRQTVGKNTTPYKFAVGSAQNARLIQ